MSYRGVMSYRAVCISLDVSLYISIYLVRVDWDLYVTVVHPLIDVIFL